MSGMYQRIKNWLLFIFCQARYLVSRAREIYLKEGFKQVIRRIRNYLFLRWYYNRELLPTGSLIKPLSLNHNPREERSIAYLLPDYECSGGIRIVFEHATRLAQRGWDVSLLSLIPSPPPCWFNLGTKVKLANFYEIDRWLPQTKMVVATLHLTLKYILDLPLSVKKFYFVQSDEQRFYEKITMEYFECEETYRVPGIELLSGSRWLKRWLEEEFNRKASFVPGKVNFDHFFPEKRLYSDRPIVLIEGNVNHKYKGVQDAYQALKGLDCEKWLLTNSTNLFPSYTKGFDKIWSVPVQDELRHIISSADILIKPSYFEGSPLSPMEAMTCGTPVIIANHLGSDEYCIEGYNSLKFMPGDIEGIKKTTQRLISDAQLRERLITNGLQYARENFDYKEAIDILEAILLDAKVSEFSLSYREFRQNIYRRYLNWLRNARG